jgi:hypothetical protein
MAIATTYLKKVHQEAIVKIAGGTGSQTIQSSLTSSNPLTAVGQASDGTTPSVSIVGVTWSGALGGIITITRGGVVVMTLNADNPGQLDFDGQNMIPDTTGSTSDIAITVATAESQVWLKLRKVSGWKTTIEPEQFGPYDNQTLAGS